MTRNVIGVALAMTLFVAATAGCHATPTATPRPKPAPSAPRSGAAKLEVLPITASQALPARALDAVEVVESVPFTIPRPENVACALEDATALPPPVELGLSREGPGFGIMRARTLVARIGVGQRELVVDAEGTNIKVRAVAVKDSLVLYPGSPITFEELLVTKPDAALGVVTGESGGVEASLALPKQIRVPKKKALTAHVPCGSLRLHQRKFDALGSVGSAIDVAYLAPDATAIATSAGGKPVAMLHPREALLEVQVLAREGRHTKIAWEVGEVVVVGWVDRSRLRSRDTGDEFGAGGLGLSGISEAHRRSLRCDADVPLRAQVGNRTEIIGVVFAGTAIEVEAERPYAFEVDVPSTALTKHENAKLLVDKEQLASCRE